VAPATGRGALFPLAVGAERPTVKIALPIEVEAEGAKPQKGG